MNGSESDVEASKPQLDAVKDRPLGGAFPPSAIWTTGGMVQRKLEIGSPDDAYEREADAVADRVVNGGRREQKTASVPALGAMRLQRQCAACEDEIVQRKPAGDAGATVVPPHLDGRLQTTRGGGHVLDAQTRQAMEMGMGYDLGAVRIHTGTEASQLSAAFQARAFTIGQDIYFGHGQFAPQTPQGKHLLAHELTHTVQQGSSRIVRRSTAGGDDPIHGPLEQQYGEASGMDPGQVSHHDPAYGEWLSDTVDAPRREVVATIDFFTGAATSIALNAVDQAILNQSVVTWNARLQAAEAAIHNDLGDDATHTQNLQSAFNLALRALFTQASSTIPNTSVVQLYLANLHRIPAWAQPNVASFNLTDTAQRTAFVTNLTNAFNVASLFQGYTTIDDATLRTLLTYLQTLITDSQNMIAGNLGNSATVLDPLRSAYRNAVSVLLTRASTTIGSPVTTLFMQYRYGSPALIHEWADQELARTTPAVPLGVAPDSHGFVRFNVNGVAVTIEPDGVRPERGAETSTQSNIRTNRFNTLGGNVTSFTPPSTPTLRIQTRYGPSASASVPSGYGRGNTTEDQRLGNTSLGYHERSHSRDNLSYLYTHPLPVFTGAVGQTIVNFQAAQQAYLSAMQQYFADLSRQSELATDCVGSPNIVTYHSNHGTTSTVSCP